MRRIKIGVIGLHYGRHIIEAHLINGVAGKFFELKGVCCLEKEEVLKAAKDFKVKAYSSLTELLKDDAIETVFLFTGPKDRAKHINQVIEAGKDVVTTKPFERIARDAREVLLKARDFGRVICLNSPSTIEPEDLKIIRKWRENYKLGKCVSAIAYTWAYYREKYDGSWYDDPFECPLAPVYRIGIYALNDLISLFGPPKNATAYSSKVFTRRETPDNAQLMLEFEGGMLGNISASFCVNDNCPYPDSLVLCFENGVIYRNVGSQKPWPREKVELKIQGFSQDKGLYSDLEVLNGQEVSGAYLWDQYYRMIREKLNYSDEYIENIVSGIEVMNQIGLYSLRNSGKDKISQNIQEVGLANKIKHNAKIYSK